MSKKYKHNSHRIYPFKKADLNYYDPIKEGKWNYLKYWPDVPSVTIDPFVKLRNEWESKKTPDSSPEKIAEFRKKIREYNSEVEDVDFDSVWSEFEPRLKNPALLKILDTIFTYSNFFIPWMIHSPRPDSWELGFGYGYDFSGFWRSVKNNRISYNVTLRDSTFIWLRERAIIVANAIQKDDHVLFLNAGCLPELRHIRGFVRPPHIIACDNEPSIDTSNIFGWSTSEHGVTYVTSTPLDMLDKITVEEMKFDTIVLSNGTLEYYSDFEEILKSAIRALQPGGKFIADVAVLTADLKRAAAVFGIWPTISNIPQTIEEAIDKVASICNSIYGIDWYYSVDTRNSEPSGIMVYVQKTKNNKK